MSKQQALENLALTMAKFRSYKAERNYSLSISYELNPNLFEIEPEVLADQPYEAPHAYRLGLSVDDGKVVFDGVFENPLEAMDLMIDGMKAKIADSSWVDWMATMDKSWSPRVA